MNLLNNIIDKAKKTRKTIVLPEGKDPRVINLDFTDYLDGHSTFFEKSSLDLLPPTVIDYTK